MRAAALAANLQICIYILPLLNQNSVWKTSVPGAVPSLKLIPGFQRDFHKAVRKTRGTSEGFTSSPMYLVGHATSKVLTEKTFAALFTTLRDTLIVKAQFCPFLTHWLLPTRKSREGPWSARLGLLGTARAGTGAGPAPFSANTRVEPNILGFTEPLGAPGIGSSDRGQVLHGGSTKRPAGLQVGGSATALSPRGAPPHDGGTAARPASPAPLPPSCPCPIYRPRLQHGGEPRARGSSPTPGELRLRLPAPGSGRGGAGGTAPGAAGPTCYTPPHSPGTRGTRTCRSCCTGSPRTGTSRPARPAAPGPPAPRRRALPAWAAGGPPAPWRPAERSAAPRAHGHGGAGRGGSAAPGRRSGRAAGPAPQPGRRRRQGAAAMLGRSGGRRAEGPVRHVAAGGGGVSAMMGRAPRRGLRGRGRSAPQRSAGHPGRRQPRRSGTPCRK